MSVHDRIQCAFPGCKKWTEGNKLDDIKLFTLNRGTLTPGQYFFKKCDYIIIRIHIFIVYYVIKLKNI